MHFMFVSPQNSYAEALILMVFGGGVLWEVIRSG